MDFNPGLDSFCELFLGPREGLRGAASWASDAVLLGAEGRSGGCSFETGFSFDLGSGASDVFLLGAESRLEPSGLPPPVVGVFSDAWSCPLETERPSFGGRAAPPPEGPFWDTDGVFAPLACAPASPTSDFAGAFGAASLAWDVPLPKPEGRDGMPGRSVDDGPWASELSLLRPDGRRGREFEAADALLESAIAVFDVALLPAEGLLAGAPGLGGNLGGRSLLSTLPASEAAVRSMVVNDEAEECLVGGREGLFFGSGRAGEEDCVALGEASDGFLEEGDGARDGRFFC